jgi:hypothetical protein
LKQHLHNEKLLTKEQVFKALTYATNKGYKSTRWICPMKKLFSPIKTKKMNPAKEIGSPIKDRRESKETFKKKRIIVKDFGDDNHNASTSMN